MLGREPRIQPPVLDAYSDMPLFNTKAVVHQTGVPAPTLRAWERRYGILSPRRGENDYRLYSERDMITVAWLRERVESGMTISQAIALLRSLEPARRRHRRGRAVSVPVLEATPAPPSSVSAAPERLGLSDLAHTLIAHCAALDEPAASRTITQALSVFPIEEVCLDLLAPVLVEIGRQWACGDASVTVEHFASALIRAQLESLFRSAAGAETGALVLVGCAPGELHEIGALTLALFLRRAGLRVAYLGQSTEVESLISTATTTGAACIVLSAVLRPHAEALVQVCQRLHDTLNPAPVLYCGGQAFIGDLGLAERICGDCLNADARAAVELIKKRLTAS